ncbi:hypothetical protein AGMMS49983_15120 [Clostridia bacterium]|nr:hypothetical protein AGMMS49983_15120 [Clostridia bacterium]
MSIRRSLTVAFIVALVYAAVLVGVRWHSILSHTEYSHEGFVNDNLTTITIVNPSTVPMEDRYPKEEAALLSSVDQDTWQTYSNEDKLEILQQVTAYEAQELGFRTPILKEVDLEDGVLANYDGTNNVINIDSAHLEQGLFRSHLNSVFHEVRHAYQHELRNMLDLILETEPAYANLGLLKNVKQIKENEEDYRSGLEDFDVYKTQPIEVDARLYATHRLEQFQLGD